MTYHSTMCDRSGTTGIHVIGGGLAGSEAAWQLAERGHAVVLH
jgi:methylenetetrahydrofolate--tRNA-(uracil-5-)-methyltransferase